MLEDFGYQVSGICYTYQSALAAINEKEFDILLTDINLGNGLESKSGIQLVEQLKKTKQCPIVFLTALSDKHTVKIVANLRPSAYLIKPVNPANLYASLQIAFENFKTSNVVSPESANSEKLDYFFVKHANKMIKIFWKDVYHLEAVKNYVKIKTPEFSSALLIRSSLHNILNEMLPPHHRCLFVRINRSEAVQKSIVKVIGIGYISTIHGDFKTSLELKKEDFV